MQKHVISAFLTGLLFGIGLLLAGMVNPEKVLGFLDIAGAWDPSLALVMVGAIAVGSIAFWLAEQRSVSLLGETMRMPDKFGLDRRLVLGSLGFGVGWGIAGICPGPALVGLGTGELKALVFVVAMAVGMAVFELLERRRAKAGSA